MTHSLFHAGLLAAGSNAALLTFTIYMIVVFGLAWAANRLLQSKQFLSEYFLGSRSLGMWAFALTFAATSASGGSFTGFPAKIYTHGWVLGLWIGSYVVVPICAMGLLGKRLNQIARISGSITVPDVLRDRFQSPAFGLLAVSLIVFFMSFNLIAQFKSGSLILKTLLDDVELFHDAGKTLGSITRPELPDAAEGNAPGDGDNAAGNAGPAVSPSRGWLGNADPEYLLCLLVFGVAVVIYTTYGGFHAVVWTDVMQGVVMVVGVIIMLPLALWQVGGLQSATDKMVDMRPPAVGVATLRLAEPAEQDLEIKSGSWVVVEVPGAEQPDLYRVHKSWTIRTGQQAVAGVDVLKILTPGDIDRVFEMHEQKPSIPLLRNLQVDNVVLQPYAYGAEEGRRGVYVTGPGPHPRQIDGFLPLSLAVSFFFMWAISGAGQPSSMVRLMAFKDSRTLQRSIFTVAMYYSMIYFPLVIIFCCARVLMPGMETEPDRIMPAMAVFLTENIGLGWLAGLLVAAPFAAVMSTVDSFLLMISSALVRDIYQRNLNPQASERTMKFLSYFFTLVIGLGAMLGAVNPPQFLQDIIVYVGSGLAACFLGPMVFALYWPRSNVWGCMGGMIAGFAAHLSMYVAGIFVNDSFFSPLKVLNFDPIIVGLFVSFLSVLVITLITPPPPPKLVDRYFRRQS